MIRRRPAAAQQAGCKPPAMTHPERGAPVFWGQPALLWAAARCTLAGREWGLSLGLALGGRLQTAQRQQARTSQPSWALHRMPSHGRRMQPEGTHFC